MGVTIQDGNGTNLVGSSVVHVLNAGKSLSFPKLIQPRCRDYKATGAGFGRQIVTTVENGPVEVYIEAFQQ